MSDPSFLPAPAPADAPGQRRALALIFLIVCLDLLAFGMILPSMQLYAMELHATVPQTGWLMAVYSLTHLLSAPFWGRLSDRIGRRPVLLVAIFGACTFQLGYGLSRSFGALMLSCALSGSLGACVGAAQAYIADVTDKESRAGAMGLIGAAFGIGMIFGPFLGGEFGHHGPRVPFFAAAALSAGNWVLACFLVKEPRAAADRDPLSALTFRGLVQILMGPGLLMLLLLYFIASFGFANLEGTFPAFCHARLGYDTRDVGRLFALYGGVTVAVQGFLVQRLAPRLGEERLVAAGLFLMAAGLVLLSGAHSLRTVILGVGVVALGSGLQAPSISSLISQAAGEQQGSVLGVAQALESLGSVLGPPLGTWVFTFGSSLAFLTAAGCMGAGLLIASALVRPVIVK